MKKYYNEKYLIVFLSVIILFLVVMYLTRPETKYVIIEESSLGYIPRNTISRKYDLEDELKSFVQVFLFKRYNYSPQNVGEQIEDSFKLSSKKVEDAIKENIDKNNIFSQIKSEKISQIFTPKDIKYGRNKDILEVTTIGERIITKNNDIDSRDNVKFSFLIRLKERDSLNPYRFYVDGIKEEIMK